MATPRVSTMRLFAPPITITNMHTRLFCVPTCVMTTCVDCREMTRFFVLLLFLRATEAIRYECPTNEVVIVQSMDVQSLRMHCAKLQVCDQPVVSRCKSLISSTVSHRFVTIVTILPIAVLAITFSVLSIKSTTRMREFSICIAPKRKRHQQCRAYML